MNESSTGRSKRKKSGKGIFLIAAVIILAALGWFVLSAEKEAENDERFTFECNAERVEFLNTLGHIVEPEFESEEITIPAEFNEKFSQYNDIQLEQGFDLSAYKGKKVNKYSYKVLNYPDYPENVVINLLFDDHRMIGADITYNDAENGFTVPLIGQTMQTGLLIDVRG